eukprot:350384-Chlamydomonas_euryale.AAC.3
MEVKGCVEFRERVFVCSHGIRIIEHNIGDSTHHHYIDRGCTRTLADIMKFGDRSVENVTIKVNRGGSLLLQSDPIVVSSAVCIELVGEDVFPQSRYWSGDINLKAKLDGNFRALVETFPNIKFLEIHFFHYNAEWSTLQQCNTLQGFYLNNYEDLLHPMRFPKHCTTDFHGFASKFVETPDHLDDVLNYMRQATGNSLQWSWSIGSYHARHHSIVNSLKQPKINSWFKGAGQTAFQRCSLEWNILFY